MAVAIVKGNLVESYKSYLNLITTLRKFTIVNYRTRR
jgi:hypothetical protein